MLRLFIEGEELDINASFSHQITYAVDDLQNLDSKTTAFSKTIVLPGTANNNRLLGNIFDFGNSNFTVDGNANVGYNFNASRSAKMSFEMNGMQIMKGTLRLLEIIVDGQNIEYEIALFGELGGFIAKLGNKNLFANSNAADNLDFSAYNHTYSISNIIASWNNANASSGYYYPLIDYGNASLETDKTNFDYRTFRPAIFVREILDKIITKNGYTWESNFFNTNFFKRLIIPNNQKRLLINKTNAFSATYSAVQTGFYDIFDPLLQANWVNNILAIGSYIGDTFIPTQLGIQPNTNKWTYNGTPATFNINSTFNGVLQLLRNTSGGALYPRYANFSVMIRKNSSQVIYQSPTISCVAQNVNDHKSPTTNFLHVFNVSHTITNVQIDLNTNDTWEIMLIPMDFNAGSPTIRLNSNSGITLTSTVPILTTPALGDTISLNDCMPYNIKQKDFFTSILKMFYLMVSEDKFKPRHLIIEPWVDFYNKDRTTYLDWSLKIDRSEPIRIKPMAELNARYYQLSYKSDIDWKNEAYKKLYNENYGDRVYDNGFEFAKDTDKTEVIFSPTVLIGRTGRDKVVSSIYKWANGIEDQMDSNIRILQAAKLTGYSNWYIRNNGANASAVQTVFPYAGHLDNPDAPNSDINFGATKELYFTLVSGALSNNLFNSYYSSYLAEITDKDSRVITVKMKFTEQEIYNLDFGKYILIDGVLYRLQKIIDYTPGELCKVELLRVISTNYQ